MSQQTPEVHCGTTQALPEQPYWQSEHHAELASDPQSCEVVQSVVTVHASYVVLPVQVVAVPGQYVCPSRRCAFDPHVVPLHPYW